MTLNMHCEGEESPWKGLVAGAMGGFVGAFAMGRVHSFLLSSSNATSNAEEKEDSTVKAAIAVSRGILHSGLTARQKEIAGPLVHYGFGTGMAAIYGTLIESTPTLRSGWGLPFGMALWLGAHVVAVPALGLSDPITRSTPASEGAELGAHAAYGLVAECVRRAVRSSLLR